MGNLLREGVEAEWAWTRGLCQTERPARGPQAPIPRKWGREGKRPRELLKAPGHGFLKPPHTSTPATSTSVRILMSAGRGVHHADPTPAQDPPRHAGIATERRAAAPTRARHRHLGTATEETRAGGRTHDRARRHRKERIAVGGSGVRRRIGRGVGRRGGGLMGCKGVEVQAKDYKDYL